MRALVAAPTKRQPGWFSSARNRVFEGLAALLHRTPKPDQATLPQDHIRNPFDSLARH